MKQTRLACLAVVLVVFGCQATMNAAENDAPTEILRVGVKPSAPFVMVHEESGEITGFSIDIIQAVAARMKPPRQVEIVVHD